MDVTGDLLVAVDHIFEFAQAFSNQIISDGAASDLLFNNKYFLDLCFPKQILHDQVKEFDK